MQNDNRSNDFILFATSEGVLEIGRHALRKLWNQDSAAESRERGVIGGAML
jgi:hypothetical protein